jgi:hypothetical protein
VEVQGNAVFALVLTLLVDVLVLHEVLALCLGNAAARAHSSAKHRTVKLIIVVCLVYRTRTLHDIGCVLIVCSTPPSHYNIAALALELNLKINALGSPISAILRFKPSKSRWSLE